MPDEQTVPQEGQTEQQVPATPENAGKTEQEGQDAHSQSVPKNLEGKSQTDLIKMYGELERKLGEQSVEVGQSRELRKDMEVVLKAIYADENLKKGVEDSIKKISGIESTNGEKKESGDETRDILEGQIIGQFLDKSGVNTLPPEQSAQVVNKIAVELRGILDPTGKKTNADIAKSLDLRELPVYLEKAYKLATGDEEISKAMQEGAAKSRLQRSGIFGGIPSGSVNEEDTLSEDERHAAKKLGLSDEDYLKYKKKLE